jgi:hypothetical protein
MELADYEGRRVRLTEERLAHIREHPELERNADKIGETLARPDVVVRSRSDAEARLYYKHYTALSIGDKYLCVVVKFKGADAFVVTAYFTDSVKKGAVAWKK